MPDYIKFYHLENYILTDVNTSFHRNGYLNAFDFFCIVIWKANRAKSKVANRLLKHDLNLEASVNDLTKKIFKANDNKEKLRILIVDYKFRLPMASTILSLLYPENFTIYDVRVCDTLTQHKTLGAITINNFEKTWIDYNNYINDVRLSVQSEVSLRDKDRILWGKSFYEQLNADLIGNFRRGVID